MTQVAGTLKAHLAVWLLVMVTGLGTLLLMEAYRSSQRAAERAYDSQLAAAALTVADAVQWEGRVPIVRIPLAALQILATSHQERVFYTVLDHDGRRISDNLDIVIPKADQAAAATAPIWRNTTQAGTRWRLHGREYDSAGWDIQDPVQIWVGHTTEGRRVLTHELFERAILRFVAMVLLAAILMLLAMRVALKPMRQLRHRLRMRQADDMRPLNIKVPEELREMVEALDTLFSRQRKSRENLLRFTADASHQLKTPLAGLQSTSELALQSRDPDVWYRALSDVHDGAKRTSRLAGQLLSLARLRHMEEADEFQPINLCALLRDSVLEWAQREMAVRHDLGLAELPREPMIVQGQAWALRELLGNLIDNALRYTPPGSEITLGLYANGDWLVLYIDDNGPGVAQEVRHRLLQPFERGGRQDTHGSGLGLAIVDNIVQRHAATLKIKERLPHGLRIEVHFQKAEEQV
ncbi:sensor histidine kinase N-terminal domain-containing protein [Halomonas sp. BMC6]|uniref:sensor histidine kinase n=1 Tax=Halomonas sp. BMC6 TaxID=3073244 RepID=UPI0030D24E95